MKNRLSNIILCIASLSTLLSSCARKNAWERFDEEAQTQEIIQAPRSPASSNKTHQINKGAIFEIVVPWDLPSEIKYENPADQDLIPFELKKSPYMSIGTAFSISNRIIVSAAHVFDIQKLSLYTPFIRIKGADGKLYEIDKVLKYSQRHDLIAFNLKSYPKGLQPLQARKQLSAGEKIYSVGSALGQGIVIRDGVVTSFTPEEIGGEWNFIRYTAPASPGNSGGALLNKDGQVVGIVTRRSENENLNFAVPIEEFIKLTKKYAIIYDQSWAEAENGKQLSGVWQDKVPLPVSLVSLSQQTHNKFIDAIKMRRAQFEQKYSNDIFPHAPRVKGFLANQRLSYRFSNARSDNNGNWEYYNSGDLNESRLEDGTKLFISMKNDQWQDVEAYVEKPKNQSLRKFLENPNYSMDRILKSVTFNRNLAGQNLRIMSLGKPLDSNWWKDDLGRAWRSSHWKIDYADAIMASHCLPYPQGLACILETKPYGHKDLSEFYARINARKWGFGYMGTFQAWKEFLALPSKYQPELFLNNAEFSYNKKMASFQFQGLKGTLKDTSINSESQMGVVPVFDIEKGTSLIIKKVALVPDKIKDTVYVREFIYPPHSASTPELHALWKELKNREAPFDGKTRKKGEVFETYLINQTSRSPASGNSPEIQVSSCIHEQQITEKESQKLCENFR